MLLDFVPCVSPSVVLDLACGAGFPTIELAERLGAGSHVHGVDLGAAPLERARLRAHARGVQNVTFYQADAAALEFDAEQFDLITSNIGINNFGDREAVLRECRRVARRGGTLALTTNLYGHMSELYTALRETLSAAGDSEGVEALAQQERSRATVEDLKRSLGACGFTVHTVERRLLKMRFASAAAFLAHSFTKVAFLAGALHAVPPDRSAATMGGLEDRLKRLESRAGLELTVPMAYLEAT